MNLFSNHKAERQRLAGSAFRVFPPLTVFPGITERYAGAGAQSRLLKPDPFFCPRQSVFRLVYGYAV